MRASIRRVNSALLSLCAVAIAVPLSTLPASADTDCYTASSFGDTWYDGDSASYRYDARFSRGPIPATDDVLENYVPQGLGTWRNWDNTTADLLVYTAYAEYGGRSIVQGINPATGERTRIAYVPEGHVGGLTFAKGYAWISGEGQIERYNLDALRSVFQGTAGPDINPDAIYTADYTSFLSSQGGDLFAGNWNPTGRSFMDRYRITESGALALEVKDIVVPKKAQGLAVTATHYFFSTSHEEEKRSNIYVVRRGYSLDSSGTSCFRAPTMSQGATLYNGKLFVLFESAAHKYTSFENPTNVIKRLHKADFSNLATLVGG